MEYFEDKLELFHSRGARGEIAIRITDSADKHHYMSVGLDHAKSFAQSLLDRCKEIENEN